MNYAQQFIKMRQVFHTPYLWNEASDPHVISTTPRDTALRTPRPGPRVFHVTFLLPKIKETNQKKNNARHFGFWMVFFLMKYLICIFVLGRDA